MKEPIATGASGQPDGFDIGKLKSSLESLGLLVDFFSRIDPFSGYDLGNFTAALRQQLSRGEHLVAFSDKRLVGYCGWLPTTTALAEAWTANKGPLVPLAPGQEADAIVVTVFAATDRKAMPALVRRARAENSKRRAFFKREYGDDRSTRKSSVENVTSRS